MNIKRVDTFPVLYQLPQPYGDANGFKKYRTCYYIRITTEDGIQGWGECVDWLPTLEVGFQKRIIPYLLGKPALQKARIVNILKKWHQRGASAVSMALTEITAKYSQLHVCELWGGRFREAVPVYASFQSYYDQPDWMQRSIQQVIQAVRNGFDMVKVKVGGQSLTVDQQHLSQLQAQFDQQLMVAIDANQSYDVSTAHRWEEWFQSYGNILWFEEPLPLDAVKDYAHLKRKLSVPLAGGENLMNAKQFVPFVTEQALDILQPDSMHHDHIDEFKHTTTMARTLGKRMSPHAFDGALSRLYAIFAQACLPPWSKMQDDQIEPVEWDFMENPFNSLYPITPVNGWITVPSGVGLGVEPDVEKLRYYRWDGRMYQE